jgi:dimethylglycine dehydrogenase
MQKEMGAVFGLNYGWEHPLWFADARAPKTPTASPARTGGDLWARMRGCCATARASSTSRTSPSTACKGPGAEDWLNAVFRQPMPRAVGRSCLTPLIGVRGGIAGDFTVTRLAEDEFWVMGSGMAERYHKRFFDMVPLPEGTTFESLTEAMCGFNVAGPKSREMLQRLTNASLATEDFPFMRSKMIELAG